MDWLRDTLTSGFESEGDKYFKNSWEARNAYIDVILNRSRENVERFLSEQAKKALDENEKHRAIKALEMQRKAMLMYTSCGWFFDEISGIETVQIMMYAARTMQLAREMFGLELENEYIKRLGQAPSNITEYENGAKTYEVLVKPAVVNLPKIGAQRTILSLFADEKASSPSPTSPTSTTRQAPCCFNISDEEVEKIESGKFRVVTSHLKVQSAVTLDEEIVGCAAIWLGDHNVSCGVRAGMTKEDFKSMQTDILGSFKKGQINETILLFPKHFGQSSYSLKNMLKDDQMRILEFILQGAVKKATDLYEIIYKDNSAMLRFMNETKIPSPRLFKTAAEIMLNSEMRRILSSGEVDVELLSKLVSDSRSLSVGLESELIGLEASEKIAKELEKFVDSDQDIKRIEKVTELIKIVSELPLALNLWHSQNIFFKMAQKFYRPMKEREDEQSKLWVAAFERLGQRVKIRLA